MEFVKVLFPSVRPVFVDGAQQGQTGKLLRLQAGTHRFDLGVPRDYTPPSRTLPIIGTSREQPMEVAFAERTGPRAGAAGRGRSRKRTSKPVGARLAVPGGRGRAGARKARTQTPRSVKPGPKARRASGQPAVSAAPSGVAFRLPSRTLSFGTGRAPEEIARDLQRAAMRWTYVVRNRERWSALPESAKKQAQRARQLLLDLGLSDADLQAMATERIVEVVVPFQTEPMGWEARIFPWEFTLAAATRDARHGESLTVLRRLVLRRPAPPPRVPQKVLYVESAPGKLRDLYSFTTERALVKSNLRAKEWQELQTPTLKELTAAVSSFRPDIIHIAGFDSHQGLRLVSGSNQRPTGNDPAAESADRIAERVPDGYLLAGESGGHEAVPAETLALALCAKGHRPELVVFSLQNSAARIAPMALANGALAAVGFQDVFDENLADLFFGSFYRAWRKGGWNLADGFRSAWETVRANAVSIRGSGLVLWSARPLRLTSPREVAAPARRAAPTPTWLPSQVPADHAHTVVSTRIEPVKELNYALLHNRRPLFEHFTLVNGSADYKNQDQFAKVSDVDVRVTLSVGAESATFQRRLAIDTTSTDLKDAIHVPLTSELMRSVHESINSSLLVEVAWGKTIYQDSHPVRLLPVDQWRDNDKDGQWLPSFVLPRDPAVAALIDKAQRYVRVLRDDPSAGFDGYQSVDPRAPEPAAEVDRQVQAIWSTIVHELNLGYINPPPTYNNAMDSQRLRTPSMIVKDHSGTCLDLALLVAACCELIDVYPVIFLLKDHAFPGYWRQEQFQQEFIEIADEFVEAMTTEEHDKTRAPGAQRVPWWFRESAFDEIVRQVKQGRLVPLESVWLTEHSGFMEAVEGGRDNLKKRGRFHSVLDVARAREAGVTPLPVGART